MNKLQAKRSFIESYYGTTGNLYDALKDDRIAVNEEWSIFIDILCRDGEITMKQYESWTFPWPKRKEY